MLKFKKYLTLRYLKSLKDSHFEEIPNLVILSKGNIIILASCVFLLIHEVLGITLSGSIFYIALSAWCCNIVGVYLGITLKVEHDLMKESEYTIEDKRCIEGCKVVCEEWGEWTIGMYDYTANALLIPEKQAALIAKRQGKYIHNMITLENPVEVIVNSNNHGNFTSVVDSVYTVQVKIDKFKKGADLSKLGFYKRG